MNRNDPSTLLPFLEVDEGEPDHRRIFDVRTDKVRSQVRNVEMDVVRIVSPDWVNVVALVPRDDGGRDLVMVRQYRFGAKKFCEELPAGMVEDGEDPVDAGLRELLEETGYAPAEGTEVINLGQTRPNPAFLTNTLTTILVPHAVKVAGQSLDGNEELEFFLLPEELADDRVMSGETDNALGIVALFRFRLWEQRQEAAS